MIRQIRVTLPGLSVGPSLPEGPPVTGDVAGPRVAATGHRRVRWPAVVTTALIVVSAAACTNSPSAAVAPPSTFGANSPWLGTFTAVALPTPVNTLSGVDCVSATRCWAVGSTVGGAGAPNGAALIATKNGGSTWAAQVIPPTVGFLSAIACTNAAHCVAVGQEAQTSGGVATAITTVDGGLHWGPVAIPSSVLDLTAVTCDPQGRCMAVGATAMGSVALVSSSSGAAWAQAGSLPPAMSGATAISCTVAGSCWVTGHSVTDLNHTTGVLALTTDDGSSWATVAIPAGSGNLTGLSCLSGSPIGSGAFPTPSTAPTTSTPATATTTKGVQPPGSAGSTTPSTSTTTTVPPTTTTTAPPVGEPGARCTVVGTTATTLDAARVGHGLMFTTDNGGATWTNQTVLVTDASLNDVSCTAIGTCVAVGSSTVAVPEAGVVMVSGSPSAPWKRPSSIGFPQPLTAVSCVSATHCVVVGESIIEHLVGG